MLHADLLPGGQIVERPLVAPAQHRAPWQRLHHPRLAMLVAAQLGQLGHHFFGEIIELAVLFHFGIGEIGIHSDGDVGGQRPRRRGPDEQILAWAVHQRQAHVDAGVLDLPAPLIDLHVGDPGGAARAPGHDVQPLVDPTFLPAALEEAPDRVVVLIGHRVVRVVPIHPLAQADGLLGRDGGVPALAVLAGPDEVRDAVGLAVVLVGEATLLLDLRLRVQALGIPAVLVALAEAAHGVEALPQVLVRAPPGVVKAPGVVGGHWTIDKRPAPVRILFAQQVVLEHVVLVPPPLDLPFQQWVIHLFGRGHWREGLLRCADAIEPARRAAARLWRSLGPRGAAACGLRRLPRRVCAARAHRGLLVGSLLASHGATPITAFYARRETTDELVVRQHDLHPLVNLALVLGLEHAHPAYFARALHVGAAIRLQVRPDDLDDAYLGTVWRQQVNLGPTQVREL